MKQELSFQQLRAVVEPDAAPFGGTAQAASNGRIIGQERALRALRFGLGAEGAGLHVYVSGPPGIGKRTSVRAFVEDFAARRPVPDDWCFVHNHKEPYEPRIIRLPTGQGREFRKDIERLGEFVEKDVPAIFESDEYSSRREEALESIQNQGQGANREIRDKAQEKGFVIQQSLMGSSLVPVKDGEALSDQDIQQLSREEQEDIRRRRSELEDELGQIQKRYRRLKRQADETVEELDRKIVAGRLEGPLEDLRESYENNEAVLEFLDDTRDDVLDNIDTIKTFAGSDQSQIPPQVKQQIELARQQYFTKFQVNVIVDNSRLEGAPVVTEINPNYNNLVGRIEKEMRMGALNTDFTLIKSGALLRANGGYLVLDVEDVLRNPYSWEALKRSLKSRELRIEEIQEQLGMMSIKTLRPQSVPLAVKVVLIGRPLIFQLLYRLDPDFHKLFTVQADFDVEMDASEENRKDFVGLLADIVAREKLPDLDAGAVSKMLEQASRRAGHKNKLTTRFGEISDLLREAGYTAAKEGSAQVSAAQVRKAVEERVYRSSMIKEKIVELIEQGTILIDTSDARIGRVNGLAVMQLGDYLFGKPNRITATVAAGREGVVDIERESTLGGPIHNKGVLILTGYISGLFHTKSGLSMTARLVFEQSYGGVDGDSASSAELYALLSALASVPIRQDIAVTGSVNQAGDVQAIGGVNEKIEGFFDVCSVLGLSGSQGVLIPESNVQNLMLREDVVEAVENKRFHVWPVAHVSEGIEALTGTSAEEVHGRVEQTLSEFQDILRSMAPRGD